jgi:hypothetical protein
MAIEQAVLARMCVAVEAGRLVMTEHAVDEMIADNLYEFDLEHCILTGDITETQWDEDFQEWKYVIEGESTDGEALAVVARFGVHNSVVVITTFLL